MENHQGHTTQVKTESQNAIGKWTLICLGVIAIAIVAVKLFNVPVNTIAYGAVLLACPLIHIFMMKGGGHKH